MTTAQSVPGLVVAGLSGGSGKSVVTVGLIRAFREQGRQVVPFKKGPDYIDAGWLARAAGRPCYNLDPYLMSQEALTASYGGHSRGADLALVEGNRGLYDGVNPEGGFSTAELARHLDLPVLLVVNCTKTTRTVAALVLGCRLLDERVSIGGVILNQIATRRHESVIRQAVEQYSGVPVLGIMPRLGRDIFPMRHLGVIPPQEYGAVYRALAELADLARDNLDLERIATLAAPGSAGTGGPAATSAGKGARSTHPGPDTVLEAPGPHGHPSRVRIGILRDVAFQFYYQDNLDALAQAGARLVLLDALETPRLPPDLDGLYIGGGFPETSARALADNASFRASVREWAGRGLPIYAECGGLIFLGEKIVLDGGTYPLAGVLPVTFGLARKPQAHGYSEFVVEGDNPFYPVNSRIRGHEFRYSRVLHYQGQAADLVLRMERGTGFLQGRDGVRRHNVMALYTHVLAPGTPQWAQGLVRAARTYRAARSAVS